MPSWLSSLSGFTAVTAEVPPVLYTLYTVHCTTAVMEGNLVGYKIPSLAKDAALINDIEPLPDWRIQQCKQISRVFASCCAHCRDFHLPTSYCFQIRFLTDRMGKRKVERIDQKEVALSLSKRTEKLYVF